MDKNPGRLVEQLQNSQLRQRKAIQQVQVDNTRLLGDLVDIRQERDAFREEAARVRRENTELRNRLDEALTECQDLKRERATLVHSTTVDSVHVRSPRTSINPPALRISTNMKGQSESSPMASEPTTNITVVEGAASRKSQPHLLRALPDPLKVASPRPHSSSSDVIKARNDSRSTPTIQTILCNDYCIT